MLILRRGSKTLKPEVFPVKVIDLFADLFAHGLSECRPFCLSVVLL